MLYSLSTSDRTSVFSSSNQIGRRQEVRCALAGSEAHSLKFVPCELANRLGVKHTVELETGAAVLVGSESGIRGGRWCDGGCGRWKP